MKSISFLAALTVTLFTLAAVHNNDVFWGDTVVLSAVRVDDETWQLFFARFDFSVVVSLGLVFVASAAFLVFRKKLEAMAFLLIIPAMVFTVTLPKYLVNRPRPEGTLEGLTNSFPSGTAAESMVFFGLLIYLVGEFVTRRKLRIALQVVLGCTIVLLGVFRLLAGEHWPSDIVGGYMAGALALIAIVWLYRWLPRNQILRG